jgi:hypothetical protein
MFFILSIRKTIRTVQKEFNHTVFVELFMEQLGEKIQSFKPKYVRNKNLTTLWTRWIQWRSQKKVLGGLSP